jgi:hypothetical protein
MDVDDDKDLLTKLPKAKKFLRATHMQQKKTKTPK